jgi:hypothetical protein
MDSRLPRVITPGVLYKTSRDYRYYTRDIEGNYDLHICSADGDRVHKKAITWLELAKNDRNLLVVGKR